MRRWVLRATFNFLLFSSALVVTSLFIFQHHSSSSSSVNYSLQQQFDGEHNIRNARDNGYYYTPESGDEYASEDAAATTERSMTTLAYSTPPKKDLSTINCDINGDYSIECLYFQNRVYFPFDFLAKYFEVYGHFKLPEKGNKNITSNQPVAFQFEHSNGGRNLATNDTQPHKCDGAFMNFGGFNVERRNKVKFVSVSKGVPLSIQWDTTHKGYHFATQVAQFGLSYYSKLVNRQHQHDQMDRYLKLNFQTGSQAQISNACSVDNQSNNDLTLITFSCKSFGSFARIPISIANGFSLSKFPILNATLDLTSSNSALSFELEFDVTAGQKSNGQTGFSKPTSKQQRSLHRAKLSADGHRSKRRLLVLLNYRCKNGIDNVFSRIIGSPKDNNTKFAETAVMLEIDYTIPQCPMKSALTMYRYLLIDVLKGLHVLPSTNAAYLRNAGYSDLQLSSINAVRLQGSGSVMAATLVQQADRQFALLAADWLVENQGNDGGWAIPINRQILSGELQLHRGWHDAMTQGQAMSLLVRAYKLLPRPEYAASALKAVHPFGVEAKKNGVVNRLFDKFEWFEEYPTTPGLFVLNGFIYSLLGLHDTSTCFSATKLPNFSNDLLSYLPQIKQKFSTGLETLRQTLALFDTGYATFYDLRHISLPGTQPNIARWEYHEAHIRQLYLLAKIDTNVTSDKDNMWLKTAKRWQGYTKGVHAPHN